MLKNAECAAIIQVIGAGSGRSFDLDAARYGKVIIMTDADVDGAHIRTLLLTLFFRYMRPLVEAGRVYAAVPPLHRIEVVNAGAKKNELIYTYSEKEMRTTVASLGKRGQEHQAAAAALQGPGRDGRRPAGRDHDGPAPPHAAPGDPARRRGGRAGLRAADGQRRRTRKDFIVDSRRRARPRAHRRLSRRDRRASSRGERRPTPRGRVTAGVQPD